LYKKILNADYSVPKFLSEEAKDFIAKIFNTDPDERMGVEEIRMHPWYKLHQPETKSFGAKRDLNNINMQIV
jgi:5'-AMP-activated protein kinase, catalytic alpha subunit